MTETTIAFPEIVREVPMQLGISQEELAPSNKRPPAELVV
jgi:hypothetical protein